MKEKIDELFESNGFDNARQEQIIEEMEIEGKIYEGGFHLWFWGGKGDDDDDDDDDDD